ncbi:hypothetical protein SAMN04488550_4444 [Gordonia malaquae]|jgi:hypothetical protein|uniref:Uncharacterized protein n=2 Tax=Gordonia malaquae TaxID=410332 RepID=M3VBW9_GORML|nr:hypothetical protein [Gordonia malaquae]GAC80993.1 hypothetical protein GM1_025_00410 [Gordonia malaquae NBRC 108250]SEE38925.1 hypothetical protein SAMN04488550_4444 [Gordonia malaquae]
MTDRFLLEAPMKVPVVAGLLAAVIFAIVAIILAVQSQLALAAVFGVLVLAALGTIPVATRSEQK